MNMFYLIELLITIVIAYFFYVQEKPKLRYLFYGYFFFLLSLFLQLPFRYLELRFRGDFDFQLMSQVLIAPFVIAVSEVAKYFSMKNFLNTKSFKNGIFFGIGWISLESVNFISLTFFTIIFSYFNFDFNPALLLNPEYGIVSFLLLFVINLAITIFVIKSIIRKKYYYLVFAMAYSLIAYYGLLLLKDTDKLIFTFVLLIISTYILFNYRKVV